MPNDRADATRLRLPIALLPDIARPVRLHGALGRSEVGGGACFGIAVAIVKS